MDGTLKQLLAEIYACHREIEALRAKVADLQRRATKKVTVDEGGKG